ncbi:hypothetical protein [Encephalitozoon cuniculi GB-M1]|uniref:Uncharacterized protein n=1 Tax=Encephalitozoon cuniculi (strain GB-M1) TaxID=284813 RepID=Q8SUU3_ENCCU|nr:uncharacterized protein ECU07_1800 [Encephalitozoon cuniculi GB-M1]CAD25711.1 hypothetical protein [Encephalitozoon cuniculi GB-M1]
MEGSSNDNQSNECDKYEAIEMILKRTEEMLSRETRSESDYTNIKFNFKKKSGIYRIEIDNALSALIKSLSSIDKKLEEAKECLCSWPAKKIIKACSSLEETVKESEKHYESLVKELSKYQNTPHIPCGGVCGSNGAECRKPKKERVDNALEFISPYYRATISGKDFKICKINPDDLEGYVEEIKGKIENEKRRLNVCENLRKAICNITGDVDFMDSHSGGKVSSETTYFNTKEYRELLDSFSNRIGEFLGNYQKYHEKKRKGVLNIFHSGYSLLQDLKQIEEIQNDLSKFWRSILTSRGYPPQKPSQLKYSRSLGDMRVLDSSSSRPGLPLSGAASYPYLVKKEGYHPLEETVAASNRTFSLSGLKYSRSLGDMRVLDSSSSRPGLPLSGAASYPSLVKKEGYHPLKKTVTAPSIFLPDTPVREFLGKDYFLVLYCLMSLGLITLQIAVREVNGSKKMMEIMGKISYVVSIFGPIIHGIWILANENYDKGVEEVIGRNWNVIGSMFPMLFGLKDIKHIKNGELWTSNGEAVTAIGGHGIITAMGIVMVYAQSLGKKDWRVSRRQIAVFTLGNILMGSAYIVKYAMPSVEDRNHLVRVGYVTFALILCLVVIVEGGKKVESERMGWILKSQWIIGSGFVVLGLQNLEPHCFRYVKGRCTA